ncbi:MAG: thioredoxin [Chlamydiae bacterium SM23_39]|nr:MAG: thioredoxin [Chlamydiae bacterium SM23_39]
MDLIKELTDEDFEKEISQGIFLVDFHATWCGPCRMLSPIIENIAKHFEKKIKIGKLDIDSEQKTAAKYQVTSVPTLILFENGKEKNRLIGLRNFDEIKELVSSLL